MKEWSRGLTIVVLLHGILNCCLLSRAFAQQTQTEYRLKAIYLTRIPDFVQWPKVKSANGVDASGDIRLCVVGTYAFGALLAQEAGRATASGKRMKIQWVRKELDFSGCQIIFVSRSEDKRYAAILNAAKGINALTVGENDRFLESGGMVDLDFESDTLKFEVNLVAVQASQFKLDARLLAMAKRVIREKDQTGT